MQRIAFIGLGTMGAPMAQHLASQGFDIVAMDVANAARVALPGATEPRADRLMGVDVVITMLPGGPEVTEVFDTVIQPGATPGTLWIDCSTVDIATATQMAARATEAGLPMIDAPVSGGHVAAGKGELSLMVGATLDSFDTAQPILTVLGQKITRFGLPGAGQAAKACHNMICGITAMAVMEGFALADAMGLDLAQFHALCAGAAAQSWTLENRCPIPGVVPAAPASNGFEPGFAAALMAKDLRLAQSASAATGQPTPFGAAAARCFTEFVEEGGGALDFSAYYNRLRPGAAD